MDINAAKALLERYGQTQLLYYYDELDDAGKRELLSNVGDIDFQTFNGVSFSKDRTVGRISPADALSLSEIEKRRASFEEAGLQAIRAGKVAAVLLAGGQGTRLGWNAPKGTFNIGVNRELSIFECQLNNLRLRSFENSFLRAENRACSRFEWQNTARRKAQTRGYAQRQRRLVRIFEPIPLRKNFGRRGH